MIGFPAVLKLSGAAQNVCVAFYFEDGDFVDGYSIVISFEGKRHRTNFAKLMKNASHNYIDATLLAQKRTLELTVRAHSRNEADQATNQILDSRAELVGDSALLALHIASRYRIDKGYSPTLFSGNIKKNTEPREGVPLFTIKPLSRTKEGMEGLVEKFQFTWNWQDYPKQVLHLFMDDYMKLIDTDRDKKHRLASLTLDDYFKLPKEVCDRLGLVPMASSQPNDDEKSGYELEPVPTFKDLLLRALTAGDDESADAGKARGLIENGTSQIDQEILNREISETFELQYKVWNNEPQIFGSDEDKLNLLISGPTGSGKTALLDILILRTIFVHQRMCIYLAPTRALTYEFYRKFAQRYEKFITNVQGENFKIKDEVVYSTGEQGEFDGSIRACNVLLACMVNEKANVLLAAEGSKLIGKNSRLGLVVIDELHMMEDAQRGGVLDLLLSKLFYFQANQQKSNRSLRIAGITTEATVNRLIQYGAFSIGENHPLQRPIELSTTRRPVSVVHKVVLQVPKKFWSKERLPEVELCNFSDTKDRLLDLATVRESSCQLAKMAGKIAPDIKIDYVDFNSVITDVIVNKLACHRLVLVAMATADLIEPAQGVKNALSNNAPDSVTLAKFNDVIAVADLDSKVRESIFELAQHGVFIHSAEQPIKLRHFVEETFSRQIPGNWKAVIFATETLSFGVNLAADCIVLGQIDFPRNIDGIEGLQSLPLRPNAFHNLLGRAGRYGVCENKGAPAEAILMLKSFEKDGSRWRAKPENDFLDQIKQYYTTAPEEEQFSALFCPEIRDGKKIADSDLSTAGKRQKDAKKWPDTKQKNAVDAYSYAALRSCCDILRFLASEGAAASSDEVVRFIVENSVFGAIELAGKTDPESKEWQNKRKNLEHLQYLVNDLLEALARDELRLLERQADNTFHVTDRASALIDTGVRPSAIKPIRATLKAVADSGRDPKDCVPLLLIGFCATPEFWSVAAREFCEDACDAYKEDSAGQYVDYAEKLFVSEINKLRTPLDSKFALSIADAVFKSAINLKHLYLQSASGAGEMVRRAVFFKLCAVTLRWLRGAPLDEITRLFPKAAGADDGVLRSGRRLKGAPSGFASKYAEKLGWLADATHKYFGDETALMPAQLKVEIKLLGERCRRGLPGHLIPFSESFFCERDGVLHPPRTRTQTIALINTELAELCRYSSGTENSERARSYFARSFRDNLAATLELRSNCPEFFNSIQQQITDNKYNPEAFLKGLLENFGSNENQSFTVDFYDGCGVVWIIGGFRFDLLLPEATPQETTAQRVVLRLVGFWNELVSTNGLRISVFGAIVLAAMIKRNLLSYPALLQLGSSGFLSVAEIVSELADPDEIKRLGCFEEQLLAFREPVPL